MADGKKKLLSAILSRKSSKSMKKSDKDLSASMLAGSEEVLKASSKSTSGMKKSDKGLSATLLAGSEEGFEFFCQPCSTENLHIEASGFCTVCKEYLCDTCFKYHRKTTATKHHQLLGKDDMPKSTIVSKPRDKLQKTCSTHPDKLIDHFCNSHSQLCCIVCLNRDHGSCRVISHIPDVSDGIADSNEYNHLMTDLQTLVSTVTKQQETVTRSGKENDKYQANALTAIRNFRQEVDSLLDKFEENAITKLSKLHYDNAEKVKAATAEFQSVTAELNGMIADLNAKAKGGKANQLFVDIKLSRERISAIEASDATECGIKRYGFHQDEKIKELTSTLSAIWSLSIRQDKGETQAQFLGEVHVKTDDDTEDCNINGIAALPGGRIVVTDFNNNAIKLVDTRRSKVTCRLPLSSKPFDVVAMALNKVAASLANEKKLEIFTVTETLSRSSTINVNKTVDKVCFDGEKFIIVSTPNHVMMMVDMSGSVLSTVSLDTFTEPFYIAMGRDRSVVYITDREAHTVTTMTLSGQIISVYKNDKLKYPLGVTVGCDDSVYVCSRDTRTVHQLTATGQLVRIILDTQRGLAPFPFAIAYNDEQDRLHISSLSVKPEHRDYVRSFKLQ